MKSMLNLKYINRFFCSTGFLAFLLTSSLANWSYGQSKSSIYFTNDYSGVYEGIITNGNSKNLVRVYLETFNYSFQGVNKDRDDKRSYFSTFRTRPEKLLYYVEYFGNKKGKGNPIKTEFHEGYYYNIDKNDYSKRNKDELIFYKGVYYTDKNGILAKNNRYNLGSKFHSKYSLANVGGNEFEFTMVGKWDKWSIKLTKKNSSSQLDGIFKPYVDQIKTDLTQEFLRNGRTVFYSHYSRTPFSPTSNTERSSLYSDFLDQEGVTMTLKFSSSEIKNYNSSISKMNWVYNLSNRVNDCFNYSAQNLKERLIYYPNIKVIKLFSCKPQVTSDKDFFHSHNITVTRNSFKQVVFTVEPTPLFLELAANAQISLNKSNNLDSQKEQNQNESDEKQRIEALKKRQKELEKRKKKTGSQN